MTARIALLMVAAVALAACESTKAVDTSPSKPVAVETTYTAPPAESRIVRGPVVADDGDVAVASYTPPKKRVKAPSYDTADVATPADPVEAGIDAAAPVSKPDKPSKPSKPDKADTAASEPSKTDTAPVTTADASSATPPASPTDT
ncbi:MAG: hypothetical protein HOP13_12030, partial [Alphaproteobacteria bacterium]|nr:hypothetical protein [Alphaproteobacteria bacterium]